MLKAAGILFMHEGRALILQRADGSGWGIPGGAIEDGETAQQAARRETIEEIGFDIGDVPLVEFSRRIKDGVDFTTFIHSLDGQAPVTLNDEHTGSAWVAAAHLAEYNLHPGMATVAAKLNGNELDVARLIRDGELTSPQQFYNVHLFDIRITGTGTAYRSKDDEFVFRDPDLYLNDEFLARCNGLPVIFEHPDENILNSEEFNQRIVGTVMLPYIKGADVWGIAKIYDDATITILKNQAMSTSPGVKLRIKEGQLQNIDDNGKLLLEDKPILLDHIAICEHGVWDKLDEPSGIVSESVPMTKPNEGEPGVQTEGNAPDLAALGPTLTAILDSVNKLSARMDSYEAEKADEAACETKMDADEEDKADAAEEDKADEAGDGEMMSKADSLPDLKEIAGLKARLDAQDAMIKRLTAVTADRSDEDLQIMANTQTRADDTARALGVTDSTRPMSGERPMDYRVRMASKFQQHSPDFSSANLKALAVADSATFAKVEERIYADAAAAAFSPANIPNGQIRHQEYTGSDGHRFRKFAGSARAAFGEFVTPSRLATFSKPVNTVQ